MKKRIIILIGLIITILGAYISLSYALFEKTEVQSEENTITTYNCLDIEIEGNNELNLINAFPIQDEEGVQTSPYTFKIKNKCDKYVSVDVGIELEENNTFSDEKLKVALNKKFEDPIGSLLSTHRKYNTENDVQVLSNQYILLHDGINANGEQNYEYRMWIDYSAGNEVVGTTFKGKIIAIATIRTEEPHGWSNSEEGMLLYALKRDNEVTNPLTKLGQEINLPEESVLASAEDDYGTSYYFRGNVQNNYLVFANKCWRIVRITGDGSIKLILYNNDSENCVISDDTLKFAKWDGNNYSSEFNNEEYINDNNEVINVGDYDAGIGFMYGTPGSDSYEKEHANLHDSTILKRLKQWYDLDGTFTDKEKNMLADVIWCNDKTITSGNGYIRAHYGPRNRTLYSSTYPPIFICLTEFIIGTEKVEIGNLSRFTAKDNINGNGMLKDEKNNLSYKIGLLTIDEFLVAGNMYTTENTSENANKFNYLFANDLRWWTLSPANTSSNDIHLWNINSNNLPSRNKVKTSYNLRPSVALTSNVKITNNNQNGTINNPYIIDET